MVEYNKVAEAAAKVEAEVKALHDKIMEIGSSKMKVQQARLDKVTKEIDETTTAINKAKVAIKNAKRLAELKSPINHFNSTQIKTHIYFQTVSWGVSALCSTSLASNG